MNPNQLTVLLILAFVTALFLDCVTGVRVVSAQNQPDFYFGIDVAYESIEETKALIDKTVNYTNSFIIGCYGDYNRTRLMILTQYVYDKGLYFMVYSDDPRFPPAEWYEQARTQWKDKFLGMYYIDEPGGNQLDQSKYPMVRREDGVQSYADAAEAYINRTNWYLRTGRFSIGHSFAYPTEFKLFTSDYALYWYDYKAGFDTVFAEFGWNYSRQINVALCRGAATAQNRDWGVMIAWTYTHPPYIESGPELYNDMVLAYQTGAKYIMLFDSNADWTAGILQQEHLDAMKQFWEYTKAHPRTITPFSQRTAYVLPEYYAYGFRGPNDKIWGIWEADSIAQNISMSVSSLLNVCNNTLDIIYPDDNFPVNSLGYENVIHWNDTRLLPIEDSTDPNTSPSPSTSPQTSSSPSQSTSPTQSSTPTSDLSPKPTTSNEKPKDLSPTIYVFATTAGVSASVLAAAFVVQRKNRKANRPANQKAQYIAK
jgi:hypothetical protein